MRDQAWLENLLEAIWQQHFHDVAATTPIEIRYGKRARARLGSLSYDRQRNVATIRLTRLFTDPKVPDMVIKATLVHELIHYAHGFHGSTRPKYDYPHRGGVIAQEFAERGLDDLYEAQKRWLKGNWTQIVKEHYPNLNFRN